MRVSERSEFVSAFLTADASAPASAFTVSLYRLDSSGSLNSASLLAYVDGAAPSATAWVALRPKAMLAAPTRIVLQPGDVVALAGGWTGALSMRFRRVQS